MPLADATEIVGLSSKLTEPTGDVMHFLDGANEMINAWQESKSETDNPADLVANFEHFVGHVVEHLKAVGIRE